MVSEHSAEIVLTETETEYLSERLHSLLGFYVSPVIEEQFARAVESIIEARIEPVVALADGWQAEVEDDGDGLTNLGKVLSELRTALSTPPEASQS